MKSKGMDLMWNWLNLKSHTGPGVIQLPLSDQPQALLESLWQQAHPIRMMQLTQAGAAKTASTPQCDLIVPTPPQIVNQHPGS